MPGMIIIPLEKTMVGRVQGTTLLLNITTIGSSEAISLMTKNLEVTILMTEGLEVILLPTAHTTEGLEMILLPTAHTTGGLEVVHRTTLRILMETEVEEDAVETVGVGDTLGMEVVEDLDVVVILEAMEDIIVVVRDRVVHVDPLSWLDYLS